MNLDSLESNSFRYTVYGSELNFKKTNSVNISFTGDQRIDYLPFNSKLNKVTTANNAGAKFTYSNRKGTKFLWNSVFRELSIDNADLVAQEPENTLLNRLELFHLIYFQYLDQKRFFHNLPKLNF